MTMTKENYIPGLELFLRELDEYLEFDVDEQ